MERPTCSRDLQSLVIPELGLSARKGAHWKSTRRKIIFHSEVRVDGQVREGIWAEAEDPRKNLQGSYKLVATTSPHPYISRPWAAPWVRKVERLIILECPYGQSLWDADLPPERLGVVMRQVTEGLAHLHDHGVIHSDLSPENILMNGKDPVIHDFDFATRGELKGKTPQFAPPEAWSYDPITTRYDIWSLGIVCFVLEKRRFPFFVVSLGKETDSMIARQTLLEGVKAFQCPGCLFEDVVMKALVPEPSKRPSAAALAEIFRR